MPGDGVRPLAPQVRAASDGGGNEVTRCVFCHKPVAPPKLMRFGWDDSPAHRRCWRWAQEPALLAFVLALAKGNCLPARRAPFSHRAPAAFGDGG
jgi:hypothetical protein